MAYKKRYTPRNRYYQSKNWSRRTQNKMGINLSTPFLAGALLGFTNHDKAIPPTILLATATAPLRGIGTIKAAAQGVIFGNMLQTFTGRQSGGSNGSASGMI